MNAKQMHEYEIEVAHTIVKQLKLPAYILNINNKKCIILKLSRDSYT